MHKVPLPTVLQAFHPLTRAERSILMLQMMCLVKEQAFMQFPKPQEMRYILVMRKILRNIRIKQNLKQHILTDRNATYMKRTKMERVYPTILIPMDRFHTVIRRQRHITQDRQK